jgi:hypothetical protein
MNWNIEVGTTFTNKDIDAKALHEHVRREYKPGYSGYDNTEYGLIAERYLMEKCGYADDVRKFKDLFSPDGESVEVKSYSSARDGDEHKQNILHNGYVSNGNKVTSLWERKVMWRKDISDYVIFFERTGRIERGSDYTISYVCDEMFEWDSELNRYKSVYKR